MYSLIRPLLFCFKAESSHNISLFFLSLAAKIGVLKWFTDVIPRTPVEVMGLQFPNPVGLAAGLDKNGDYYDALGQLGFGFVEIGTVTPLAQPGNPKPRMFRLRAESAIINRMGFNNKGVDYLVEQVRHSHYDGILGINIGKNKATPEERAVDDYVYCMNAVYPYADYITINISSPNTPGLRNLQYGEALTTLLTKLKSRQAELTAKTKRYVPLAVKIAPDMSDEEVEQVADTLLATRIDAVIATNTTLDRDAVKSSVYAQQAGGLSGAPLKDKSTHVISVLNKALKKKIPIIGVGGITCAEDAAAKIRAGASLVQLYSGLIYRGPELIAEAAKAAALALVSPAK